MSESGRPVYIDAKWDTAIDLTLRRAVYGILGGGLIGFILLRAPTARATAMGFGAGFGVGSAYQETRGLFADLVKGPEKS